jgi:hypothetical protein
VTLRGVVVEETVSRYISDNSSLTLTSLGDGATIGARLRCAKYLIILAGCKICYHLALGGARTRRNIKTLCS